MTQDRFLKMLGDADLLATISYQELKTLALAYPYAHNLHMLLALKARQDNHPDFNRALAAAAANSLSRPRLFQLIAPQRVTVMEEVLELRAIEAVQQELAARAPVARQTESETLPAASAAAQVPPAVAPPQPSHQSLPPEPTGASAHDSFIDREEGGFLRFDQWLDQFNLNALTPCPKRTQPPTEDKPGPEPRAPQVKEKTPAQPAEAPPAIAQSLAERSISARDEVVSETMARLFAAQGHREKAIAMYERLRLVFPEKSDYFAAEIDKLKK
ncbi:MAG: hypothetical protein IT259_07295 [Saprospiraceae bacterium]|nr:hypothetical protein [Saprospiraceae bacterium]